MNICGENKVLVKSNSIFYKIDVVGVKRSYQRW